MPEDHWIHCACKDKPCERCNSYAARLDELNKDFNKLWDYLKSVGIDPEKVLNESNNSADASNS